MADDGARFSLKDHLFNPARIAVLSAELSRAWPGFDGPGFEERVNARLPELELKARIAMIAEVLADLLPDDFAQAAEVIERALPPPLDPELTDDDFGSFLHAPYGDFIVARGMEDHRDRALDLLEQVTMRFSMEYAIRHFLNRWPEETMARLRLWADHPNYHVRRLVSEGTRPKLPWGIGIALPPGAALPLLDRLHADSTRYVTRSVANHLNDVAKIDAGLALDRLRAWRDEGRQAPEEQSWMTAHALRGLVKAGDPQALALLGYASDAPLAATLEILTPEVPAGGELRFRATIEATGSDAVPVLVDHVIDFARPGDRRAQRVFKLKQGLIRPGTPLVVDKRQRLKADATTYRLHPGRHRLSLQVNGRILADAAFDVV